MKSDGGCLQKPGACGSIMGKKWISAAYRCASARGRRTAEGRGQTAWRRRKTCACSPRAALAIQGKRRESGLPVEGEGEEVGLAELGGEEVAGIGENDGEEVAEGAGLGGDGDGEEGLLRGERREHQEELHLELGVLAGEEGHAVLRGLGYRRLIPAADHQPELDVHAAGHALFKCPYGVLSGNSSCARYSELDADCLWWVTADRKMPPLTTGKQGNDCNCARNTALYTDISSK